MADKVVINKPKAHTWIAFIGSVLLLIGIYAGVRTGMNVALFDKYPQNGVLSINFNGTPPYFQMEKDCSYPQTYTDKDGKSRPATVEEKNNEQEQKRLCLEGVKEARNNAKVNDISQSLFFLFLGAGILVTRKLFFL